MKLKKLFRLNLTNKLILMALAITVIFCLTLAGLYKEVRNSSFNERRLKVQHQTETAWSVLQNYVAMEQSGQLSRSEAQKLALTAVEKLRYGKSGYFWINDLQPKMLMHPIKPALDGKDLSRISDPTGKKLFVEFVNVSRKQGGGFVNYLWPKPGFDEPVEKISYVKRLAAWDWIVGTGLYVDDVEATLGTIRSSALITVLIVICITGILVWLVNRSIVGPILSIRKALYALAKGKTDIQVDCGKPVDCSKRKNCSVSDCPSYGREDVCWVTAGSFSADIHCPRALRGEDCSSCELYGPKNNMQELGSALMGLANAMKLRANLARQIADGDLTQEIKVASDHDDLGLALVQMHQNLKNILSQLVQTAAQIDSGSARIEGTSQSLTDGATQQAAAIQQINSSVSQMAEQTRQNAEHANQANGLAHAAKDSAEQGNRQMTTLVQAMAEINESGQNISKIIKVIDEIAFQTNLLALNAAVEAARAGQHGKGFAVVAEEVRNLAARSANAAQETAELIEGSVSKASNGAQLADTTATALSGIVEGITKATDLMGEIATASNDQAQSTDQINTGLTQIDSVGQKNSAFAEETATTAGQLAGQARHLSQLLSMFTLPTEISHQAVGNTLHQPAPRTVPAKPRPTKAPAAKPSKPPAPPLTTATATTSGWGDLGTKTDRSAPQIALDDDEFGKY
ncbi:MAG: chemotaxis protein [Deltaproteobacteria bacterium]|nr:chemotaxis protein [Deltaproteobacteria bacterium]